MFCGGSLYGLNDNFLGLLLGVGFSLIQDFFQLPRRLALRFSGHLLHELGARFLCR